MTISFHLKGLFGWQAGPKVWQGDTMTCSFFSVNIVITWDVPFRKGTQTASNDALGNDIPSTPC